MGLGSLNGWIGAASCWMAACGGGSWLGSGNVCCNDREDGVGVLSELSVAHLCGMRDLVFSWERWRPPLQQRKCPPLGWFAVVSGVCT